MNSSRFRMLPSHLVVKMDGADCTRVDKVRNLIDYELRLRNFSTPVGGG